MYDGTAVLTVKRSHEQKQSGARDGRESCVLVFSSVFGLEESKRENIREFYQSFLKLSRLLENLQSQIWSSGSHRGYRVGRWD